MILATSIVRSTAVLSRFITSLWSWWGTAQSISVSDEDRRHQEQRTQKKHFRFDDLCKIIFDKV
jgi:hypothetical protein